jgi:hypothetical protein
LPDTVITPVIAIAPFLLRWSAPHPVSVWPRGIAESGHGFNVPGMFAALLLLYAARIGIYRRRVPASQRVLRRWRDGALGKENGWSRVCRKRSIC